jgi:hypothetical protein
MKGETKGKEKTTNFGLNLKSQDSSIYLEIGPMVSTLLLVVTIFKEEDGRCSTGIVDGMVLLVH